MASAKEVDVGINTEATNNDNDKDKDNASKKKKSIRWASDVEDPVNTIANTVKLSASNKAKQKENVTKPKVQRLCSFCSKHPACLRMKASWRGKDKKQALCLLHYYTTLAVHADSDDVVVLDSDLLQAQLNGQKDNNNNKLNVQDLFAEAYTQLQSLLAQESLQVAPSTDQGQSLPKSTIHNKRPPPKDDPLQILHDLGKSHKKPKLHPKNHLTNQKHATEGGFLKPIPIPERLRKTQQQQAKWQAEQLARMQQAAQAQANHNNNTTNNYQRKRQTTRKNLWNSVLEKPKDQFDPNIQSELNRIASGMAHNVTCSCGSHQVEDIGNVTSRNADVRKGEVWGSGGRDDDVLQKYRCNQCGKTWQEVA